MTPDTHDLRCGFGRRRGTLWTRTRAGYLESRHG